MSFNSKAAEVLNLQNSVEEVSIKLGDAIATPSGSTVAVDLGETIKAISSVIFIDDSAGTAAPVTFANQAISGTVVTLTLSAALAVHDAVIVRYTTNF